MLANGREMPLTKPVLAVIDTGTTGLVISDSLYESDEFPLPGAAVRTLDVTVRTESGKPLTLSARRPRNTLGLGGGADADDAASVARRRSRAPPTAESFPLIATPVSLGWFDRADVQLPPGQEKPHVIFLGLAFLSKLQLTIDADEMRLFAKQQTFEA